MIVAEYFVIAHPYSADGWGLTQNRIASDGGGLALLLLITQNDEWSTVPHCELDQPLYSIHLQ